MATTEVPLMRRLENILAFEHLEKPVQAHLKKVYTSLTLCMLLAAVGAYVHLATGLVQAGLLTSLGSIGLMLALRMTPHTRDNEGKRFAFLCGFAGLSGVGLAPLLDICIRINPAIIPTALMATMVVFACFSLSVLLTNDKRYLFLGGTLMNALMLMTGLGLANLFLGIQILNVGLLYLGLLVMCGFVLYDTQLMIEKKRRGDDDYMWHCVELFIDMIQLFRYILILLANKEEKNKRRN